MDQLKIGKFIAECRKRQGLTQMQLAEKFNVTDRAVSKWENGRAMPDSSIMLELCDVLKITVNDLLSGEVVTMDNYNKELEKNLLEAIKQKEQADKRLLILEVFVGLSATVIFLGLVLVAALVPMSVFLRVVLLVFASAEFFAGCFFALWVEQTAGYYECRKCGHKYVPTYKQVTMAQHMGRTRYMRCPKCDQKSWCKKVISK